MGVTGGTGLALALVLGTTWMVLRSDALSLKNGKQLCFALVLVALGTAATTAVHRCTPPSPWFALRWFNTSAGRVVRKPAHCSQPSSVTFSQGWRDVCAGRLPQRAVPRPTAADLSGEGVCAGAVRVETVGARCCFGRCSAAPTGQRLTQRRTQAP